MTSKREELSGPARPIGPVPGTPAPLPLGASGDWPGQLEIIGAELFQRYRKRLMMPGIAWEIRRDYPGLSLADVLVRVHAGRRLLQSGDDFHALEAIRSGRWQLHLAELSARAVVGSVTGDRLSRWLVRIGGMLFILFCMLSLASVLPLGPAGTHLFLGLAAGVGFAVWCWLSWRDEREAQISGGPRDILPTH